MRHGCAQRLSASKKFGPELACSRRRRILVLNAFRHQRSSDKWKRWDRRESDCAQRLSASKKFGRACRRVGGGLFASAQRLSASKKFGRTDGTDDVTRWQCSTPFGIKEVRTTPPEPILKTMSWCSTPFGIKEVRTRRDKYPNCYQVCAQRLSASKKFGQHESFLDTLLSCVLNAFRHQRSSDRPQ